MGLVKAIIELIDPPDPERQLPAQIPVQFNPAEYSRAKSALLAEIGIPGLDSPILQFVRGQNERITLDLLFDTTDDGMAGSVSDVSVLTEPLHQLVKVQPKTHAVPRFRLTWGPSLSFEAVAESVQQRFVLFSPDGVPLRAQVSVAMREYVTLQKQLQELNLQSSDHTRVHLVRGRETMPGIAAAEYGDPAVWRVIADSNPGSDPRRPAPGTLLRLPPLEPGAGRS